jgi:hypothetical protein
MQGAPKSMKFASCDSGCATSAKEIDDGKKHDGPEKRNEKCRQTQVGLIDRPDAT